MHLRYDLMDAHLGSSETRHPQEVMKALGITYQHATPQSMAEQWWFWNCENVPSSLPPYLIPMTIDPMGAVGYGLSKEDAEKIISYKSNQTTNEQTKEY